MNILELPQWKKEGRKITMVTSYDHWSARLLAETGVDMLLVGDSGAMIQHGCDDTVPATVDMMETFVRAVKKAAPGKFVVGDLPFLSSDLESARRIMQAGAQALKLEGYDEDTHAFVSKLTRSGVPVMGHLGLTPQFVNAFGGFKVQGRSEEAGRRILEQARGLESAGVFAIVLECVPRTLAAEITSTLRVPTIGIGAGEACDGQVLVLHDLLGLSVGHRPKFVRTYLNGADLVRDAVERFRTDVNDRAFPSAKETYE